MTPNRPSSLLRACRQVCALFVLGAAFATAPSPAVAAEFVPNPNFVAKADTYICPDATGGAVDCYLQAVSHLYTMCRNVKSIEIIEFGYEKSAEGTNGAKFESCVDKHRLSMTRPYQAALKEATPNREAVNDLRALQELWLKSLADLKWTAGETDEQYKLRVAKPYELFSERAAAIRAELVAGKTKASTVAAKGKAGAPEKGKASAADKSKSSGPDKSKAAPAADKSKAAPPAAAAPASPKSAN